MKMTSTTLTFLVTLLVSKLMVAMSVSTAAGSVTTVESRLLQSSKERKRIIKERQFFRDRFDDSIDECMDPETKEFGKCNLDLFPICNSGLRICYNRFNRRDKFYDDWIPYSYINYNAIKCIPSDWNCSSCSPGRYCNSEKRCVADELIYHCKGYWGEGNAYYPTDEEKAEDTVDE